jgi:hypothetical protein
MNHKAMPLSLLGKYTWVTNIDRSGGTRYGTEPGVILQDMRQRYGASNVREGPAVADEGVELPATYVGIYVLTEEYERVSCEGLNVREYPS